MGCICLACLQEPLRPHLRCCWSKCPTEPKAPRKPGSELEIHGQCGLEVPWGTHKTQHTDTGRPGPSPCSQAHRGEAAGAAPPHSSKVQAGQAHSQGCTDQGQGSVQPHLQTGDRGRGCLELARGTAWRRTGLESREVQAARWQGSPSGAPRSPLCPWVSASQHCVSFLFEENVWTEVAQMMQAHCWLPRRVTATVSVVE